MWSTTTATKNVLEALHDNLNLLPLGSGLGFPCKNTPQCKKKTRKHPQLRSIPPFWPVLCRVNVNLLYSVICVLFAYPALWCLVALMRAGGISLHDECGPLLTNNSIKQGINFTLHRPQTHTHTHRCGARASGVDIVVGPFCNRAAVDCRGSGV